MITIPKGCTIIYAPKGNAGEYAPLACNPYEGCGHACKYCYVPLAMHLDRSRFNAGAVKRKDFLKRLQNDAERFQRAGATGQVFVTFSSDPYHPTDTQVTRWTLEILADHGLGFCALTKGGLRSLVDMDLFRPERDAYACTLTSLSNSFAKKWEPDAAPPADRLTALRAFHARGIFTWVSLEPTLDVEASLSIVEATHAFVDLYKIGRANYLKEITRTTDWATYTQRMIAELQHLGKAHYIKEDLQGYLPAGYHNPLRVRQHHGGRHAA